MKSDYASLWYAQFRKLRVLRGGKFPQCNDLVFDTSNAPR